MELIRNATGGDFQVPFHLEYIAIFAWASSGAIVGIRKHFDIVGVFVIALLSSTGGGLVRDAILLQRTPLLLTDPVYLTLVILATALMSLFTGLLARIPSAETGGKLVDVIDAIGTPAFTVIGMQLAEHDGIPILGVLFVGIVNGVSGGLLRDIVVRDVPALLRPGQFLTLILLSTCALFMTLTRYFGVKPTLAAWTTVAGFFFLRVLAIRFNWHSRSVLPHSE